MIELSVIICSHNPRREYLQRTLAGLKEQTLPQAQWELLLVDNASRPPVSADHRLDWHCQGRHLVEAKLGLTPARVRGVAEARGGRLVFVDDDNVLAADYLARVLAIAAGQPRLAVFGAGTLRPEFEVPPPPELKELLSLLALREVDAPRRAGDPREGAALPCGAGLTVSRAVAGRFAELVGRIDERVVLDRKGGQLFSHGDDLFSWAAAGEGLEFGVFPELRITHLIGAGRLSRDYFLRLIYYHTFSHCILRYLLAGEAPRRMGLWHSARLAAHAVRRGMFSARCQRRWQLGERDAAQFIRQNQLAPLAGVGAGAVAPARS